MQAGEGKRRIMLRKYRLVPIVLFMALALLFPAASNEALPDVRAAGFCDWASFVMDVTIPDGTIVAPNTPLTKTWRLKNIGTCTWTTAYALQFVSGDQMSAPASVNLPSTVTPGQTVDVSVQLVAPATPGHFRGNWMLKNAAGATFGIGSTANSVFWVDINVSAPLVTAFDFTENVCAAQWVYNGGPIPCPTNPNKVQFGYVKRLDNPTLENGTPAGQVGLLTVPQDKYNGVIMGIYDVPDIFRGDHFQALLSCQYGAVNCYVTFELDYITPSNDLVTIWKFREKYDGLFYRADVDLSRYADLRRIRLVLIVNASGPATGDMPLWIAPRIVRPVAGQTATTTPAPLPVTPTSTSVVVPPVGTPTSTFVPASSCDKAQFIQDVTIPDGTSLAPGQAFTKTWRLKNVGTCTWSQSYSLVYVSGDQMGGPTSVPLPTTVNPGATVDLSVNLTAPTEAGNYAGYWMLRNSSAGFFGIGSSADVPFWVKISVLSASLPSSFDFVGNLCAATWLSGAGYLPCPGTDGSPAGFALRVDQPVLENGTTDSRSGILESPQAIDYGWIQGIFPATGVQNGDRFQSTINCQFNATTCDVFFRLDYQIGNGPISTLWAFHERYEGLSYNVDLDLSSLAGQNVRFILTILSNGSAVGDRAMWVGPRIYHPSSIGGSGPALSTPVISNTPEPVLSTPTP
jgi:Ig-like domain-containing protein